MSEIKIGDWIVDSEIAYLDSDGDYLVFVEYDEGDEGATARYWHGDEFSWDADGDYCFHEEYISSGYRNLNELITNLKPAGRLGEMKKPFKDPLTLLEKGKLYRFREHDDDFWRYANFDKHKIVGDSVKFVDGFGYHWNQMSEIPMNEIGGARAYIGKLMI